MADNDSVRGGYFYLRNSRFSLKNSRLWNSSLGILDLVLGILKFIEKFRIPKKITLEFPSFWLCKFWGNSRIP